MTVPNVFPVLAFSFAGLVAVFVGYIATSMPMFVSIGMVLGVGAAILTFVRPQLGLGLIVFSMLLSPEFPIAQLAKRAVIVRLDDLLLIGVFFAWLTRAAIYKELPSFSKIPLLKQMGCYAIVCVVSTMLGIVRGDIQPLTSFFYVAKYVEYFLLYFMVVSVISSAEQVKGYLLAGLITAFIVCLHAYYWMYKDMRPYAPFDIEKGIAETASLAGYLMIVMSVAIGFFAHTKRLPVLLVAIGIIIFAVPPFLYCESRASYAASIPMLLASVFVVRQRKLALIGALMILTVCVLWLGAGLVKKVQQRIMYTFLPAAARNLSQEFAIAGAEFALEESAATRMRSWQEVLTSDLVKHPFIGTGITGVGLRDTNYPLIIGETGLIGFCLFVWLLLSVLFHTFKSYRLYQEPVFSALNIGLLAATIGVCIQAVAVNTFIIIRIMEPFWFLTALTMKSNSFIESRPQHV